MNIEGHFVENLGQLENHDIRFYAAGEPFSVGLTSEKVMFLLSDPAGARAAAFSMIFDGGLAVEPRGVGEEGPVYNYFLGNDPTQWVRGARTFSEIWYDGIYENVDLRFYFADGKMKYDFLLDAHVESSSVTVRYEGVESLSIEVATGDLLIETAAGNVRDERPIAYQGDWIQCEYILLDGHSYTIDLIGDVDPDLPLIIDPGLEFSTYIGGSNRDVGYVVTHDSSGDVYVGGHTDSPGLPMTDGRFDATGNATANLSDVYVAKFDSVDGSCIYITYLGGTAEDRCYDLEVTSDGYLYVLGKTNSTDFPVTPSALNGSLSGLHDGFLVKMDADGSRLIFGTYYGGSMNEWTQEVRLDAQGNVVFCGLTNSTDFPVSQGAYCSTLLNTSDHMIFVVKIDSSLSNVLFSTFVGIVESSTYQDLCLDSEGNIYIAGRTDSELFPTTPGSFQSVKNPYDSGFIAKVDSSGSRLLASTFFGGGRFDYVSSIVLGDDGSVYAVGTTSSTDLNVTSDALYTTLSGEFDGYIAVFDSSLSTLRYCTYFGASGKEFIYSLQWGPNRNVLYFAGLTTSFDLPVTQGTIDPEYRGGKYDVFMASFDTRTKRIAYCTYLGGEDTDYTTNNALSVDDSGNVFLGGYVNSSGFPVTQGAFIASLQGDFDAYVLKVDPRPTGPPTSPPQGLRAETDIGEVDLFWDPSPIEGGRVISYNIYRGLDEDSITWIEEIRGGFTEYVDDDPFNGATNYYGVSANNTGGEGPLSNLVTARPVGPPTAPMDLDATTGDGTVRLNWSEPLGKGGGGTLRYRVLRGPMRLELEPIGQPVAGTEFIDQNVTIGSFYYYSIFAFNEYGQSPETDTVRIKAVDVPSSPVDFRVTPGDGFVSLSWRYPKSDGGALLQGFHVWKGVPGGQVSIIATLIPGELTFRDTDVVNGKAYLYHVTAYTRLGEGLQTVTVDAIPFGLPSEPMNVKAIAGNQEVNLTWTPPDIDGGRQITKYIIYWGTSAGNLDRNVTIGNMTQFHHHDLTNGVTYHYEVSAINEAGVGRWSETVQATPSGPPSEIRDLEITSTPEGVRLTWRTPTDAGGATTLTYQVLRGTVPDADTVIAEVTEMADRVEPIEYVDTAAVKGTTYHYTIVAMSSFGEGPRTTATIEVLAPPGQVTDVAATSGNAVVDLSWTAPDDGGSPITQYVVLRGVFETGLAEIGRVDGTVLNYTDDTAENGRSYFYKVYAVNAIGAGTRSESVPATPRGPPPAPGVLEARVKDGAIVLTWAAPTGGNTAAVTGYKVYRGDSEFELVLLEEVGNVLSYIDEDVKANRPYYYKVLATSESGDGDMSRLADARVKKDEGPGFEAAVLALAMLTIAMLAITRRRGKMPSSGVRGAGSPEQSRDEVGSYLN